MFPLTKKCEICLLPNRQHKPCLISVKSLHVVEIRSETTSTCNQRRAIISKIFRLHLPPRLTLRLSRGAQCLSHLASESETTKHTTMENQLKLHFKHYQILTNRIFTSPIISSFRPSLSSALVIFTLFLATVLPRSGTH